MNNKSRKTAWEIMQSQKKTADISNLDPKVIATIKKMDSGKEPEPDYMQLARDHALKYNKSLVDSMRWVEQKYPHKLREYIKAHNPEM